MSTTIPGQMLINEETEEQFLTDAFAGNPIEYNDTTTMSDKVDRLNGTIDRMLSGGKSGASVFLCKDNRILKLYLSRDEEDIFTSKVSSVEDNANLALDNRLRYKSNEYTRRKGNYDGDMTYFRSLRDILISSQLSRLAPGLTPNVYEYGFLKNVDVSNGKLEINENTSQPKYIPYIVSEKIEGNELAKYKPTKGVNDLKILRSLMAALKRKYTSIVDMGQRHIGCHRDLHPGNIFVVEKGGDVDIRLIDFDLSVSNEPLITKDTSCTRRNLNRVSEYGLGERVKGTLDYTGKNRLGLSWKSRLSNRFVRADADLYNYFSFYIYFEDNQPANIKKKLKEIAQNALDEIKSDSKDRKLDIMVYIVEHLGTLIDNYDTISSATKGGTKRSQKRRKSGKMNKTKRKQSLRQAHRSSNRQRPHKMNRHSKRH